VGLTSDAPDLQVVPSLDDNGDAACTCCAGQPGLRGYVYRGGEAIAVYFVEPAGMPKFPLIKLGIVFGRWEGMVRPEERLAIAFSGRPGTSGPQIHLIDPWLATIPDFTWLGRPIQIQEARQHHDAAIHEQVARAIVVGDSRLSEISGTKAEPRFWASEV